MTIPYTRHTIEQADIDAVTEVLASDWLTTGPQVEAFERAVAEYTGAARAVAVNSGTAALHCAMRALGVGPGDEVIVPTLTFAASANAVLYEGATPVLVDVEPGTLQIDCAAAEAAITPRTVALVAVDYAGQPCDHGRLRALCERHGLALVADAAHSLGAAVGEQKVGRLADLTIFSFHPAKAITSAEGGMVVTEDAAFEARMRRMRNQGLSRDLHQRRREGGFGYEVVELGHNYRLSDLQAALGRAQLGRLDHWIERRRVHAEGYLEALAGLDGITPLECRPGTRHAWHLFVARISGGRRDRLFDHLRGHGIGAAVHYPPLHLQPLYRDRLGTRPGQCPVAEAAFSEILSLPLYPGLEEGQRGRVVAALAAFFER